MYNGRISTKISPSTRFANQIPSTQPINSFGQTLFFESRSANASENFLTTTSGTNLCWDVPISRDVIFNSASIMKCCLDSSNVSSFVEKFCVNDVGQATKFEQLIAYLTKEFANNDSDQKITAELIKNVLYQIFPNIEEITANDVKIVLRMSVSENFFNRYFGYISYSWDISYSGTAERIMSSLGIRFSTECLTSSNFDNIHKFCKKIIGHVPVGVLDLKSLCDNLCDNILTFGIGNNYLDGVCSHAIKLCQYIYYYTELSKINPNHTCLPELLENIEKNYEKLKLRTSILGDDVSKLLLVFQSPEVVNYLQNKLSKQQYHVEIFNQITTLSGPFPATNLDINLDNLEQLTNLPDTTTELFDSRVTNVTIQNCSFSGMSFTNVKFDQCNFEDVDLSKCKFNSCIFDNCSFPKTNLTDCVFENVKFSFSDFNRADCSYANFNQIEFAQTSFANCKLECVKNITHRSADNLSDTFSEKYLQQVILQFAFSLSTIDDMYLELKNVTLENCIKNLNSKRRKCVNNNIHYNDYGCNEVIGDINSLIKQAKSVSLQPSITGIEYKLIQLVETNPDVFIQLLPYLYSIALDYSSIDESSISIKTILTLHSLPNISHDLLVCCKNNKHILDKFIMNLTPNYTRVYFKAVHVLSFAWPYRFIEIKNSNGKLSNLDLSNLCLRVFINECDGTISFEGSKFNHNTRIFFDINWSGLTEIRDCEEFILKCISVISTIDECLELKFKLVEEIKYALGITKLCQEDKEPLLQLCDDATYIFLKTCKPESINNMVEIQARTKNHALSPFDRLKKIIDTLIKFDAELLNKFMCAINSTSLPQDLSLSVMGYQKIQSMMVNSIDFNMQEVNSRLEEFRDLHLNIIRRMPIADRVSYDELTSFVFDGGKLFQLNAYYNDKKNPNQSYNMIDFDEL